MNRVFLELFSNQWWPLIACFIIFSNCNLYFLCLAFEQNFQVW